MTEINFKFHSWVRGVVGGRKQAGKGEILEAISGASVKGASQSKLISAGASDWNFQISFAHLNVLLDCSPYNTTTTTLKSTRVVVQLLVWAFLIFFEFRKDNVPLTIYIFSRAFWVHLHFHPTTTGTSNCFFHLLIPLIISFFLTSFTMSEQRYSLRQTPKYIYSSHSSRPRY